MATSFEPARQSDIQLFKSARKEVTSRLLAVLINERLVSAIIERLDDHHSLIRIRRKPSDAEDQDASVCEDEIKIMAGRLPDSMLPTVESHFTSPDQLNLTGDIPDPSALFKSVYALFAKESTNREKAEHVVRGLSSTVENQAAWFRLYPDYEPGLSDGLILWERAIIRGHPTHPMHKSFLAQPPLSSVSSEDLQDLLTPDVVFFTVLREQVKVIGPFETLNRQFSEMQGLDAPAQPTERLILPCLARQLPAILKLYHSAKEIDCKPFKVEAQASIRTVSMPANSRTDFPYHLKFALACEISSAVRTITPWTACIGPEVTKLLDRLLPADLWVFREVAAVTGAQEDFSIAKHISVLIREDLDFRARRNNEALIPAAALAETTVERGPCHAERLFGLCTIEEKLAWFRDYVRKLLQLTLPPAYKHGIALEAHSQNMCARFSLSDNTLRGFAYRDFGGMKLHMPTLRSQGHDITSSPPASLILIKDIHECWDVLWHTLFRGHLTPLLRALGLEQGRDEEDEAWGIILDEVESIFEEEENLIDSTSLSYSLQWKEEEGAGQQERKKALRAFLLADQVPYKCLLRMMMEGLYRDSDDDSGSEHRGRSPNLDDIVIPSRAESTSSRRSRDSSIFDDAEPHIIHSEDEESVAPEPDLADALTAQIGLDDSQASTTRPRIPQQLTDEEALLRFQELLANMQKRKDAEAESTAKRHKAAQEPESLAQFQRFSQDPRVLQSAYPKNLEYRREEIVNPKDKRQKCALKMLRDEGDGVWSSSDLVGSPYEHQLDYDIRATVDAGKKADASFGFIFRIAKVWTGQPINQHAFMDVVEIHAKFRIGAKIGDGAQVAQFAFVPFNKLSKTHPAYDKILEQNPTRPHLCEHLGVYLITSDGFEISYVDRPSFDRLPEGIRNAFIEFFSESGRFTFAFYQTIWPGFKQAEVNHIRFLRYFVENQTP